MHCAFSGQGNKTIVYLHGWGADGTCFAPVAACLGDCHNVMPDLGGFGKSPCPPAEGWRVADYAEAVRLLCVQYNIQHATFVCHSFGCRVALVLAANCPGLTDGLLLYAPAGLRSPSVRRFAHVAVYKVQKAFRGLLGMPQKSNVGSADYVATPDCLKPTFVKVVNQDLSRFARRVRCPSLVVCGKCDTTTPPKSAARMAKLIPQGNLQLIDGDHFTLFSRPKVFARIVREFTLGV